MARQRKICINPPNKNINFYIVDTNFLVNKYLTLNKIEDKREKERIEKCQDWWKIIEGQINKKRAIVYIPDICIAEVIKVFSKKYYCSKSFTNQREYKKCVNKFLKDIRITHKELSAKNRHIKYHDISTSRDILISVERFNRIFHKYNCEKASVVDLIIVSTAKYLMDFYNIPYEYIHIITMDRDLKRGSNKIKEIPTAYDPTTQKPTNIFK